MALVDLAYRIWSDRMSRSPSIFSIHRSGQQAIAEQLTLASQWRISGQARGVGAQYTSRISGCTGVLPHQTQPPESPTYLCM